MQNYSFGKNFFKIPSLSLDPDDPTCFDIPHLKTIKEHDFQNVKSPSTPCLPQLNRVLERSNLDQLQPPIPVDISERIDQESEDENSSFYSAYLRVQEQKFQQQLQNLEKINERLRQLDDRYILSFPLPADTKRFGINTQAEKENGSQVEQGSQLAQIAYILGELITIDACKQSAKFKLRFRLFDILQLFGLNSKTILKKEFYHNVSRVLGNKSHDYLDKVMRFIFGDKQEINREHFSAIFRSNSPENRQDSSSQTTLQLVKQFFSALYEVLYFQERLRKASQDIDSDILQEAISKEKSFSVEDIQIFIAECVKVSLQSSKIEGFFNRILRPRRSGDFLVKDFTEWLNKGR